MNSTSYDINSSPDITQMSEAILESNSSQPLVTTNDIDTSNEEKHLLSNQDYLLQSHINNIPLESPASLNSNIPKRQESLISVYDNSNDGEQQQKQQTSQNSFPQIGILGRNQRSQAFTKRLLLSGFPKPILCDRNTIEFDLNEKSNYVSYETFCKQSPPIILITDNLTNNIDDFINHDKQQLIIDARESIEKYLSNQSSQFSIPIPSSYRAFGNLSNWEIENGTQRVGVAIEQASPLNLIKFIHDLSCFSRGIIFLDQYSYNYKQLKSFRHCSFPFVATMIIFTLCFVLSMLENKTNNHYYQACSITGTTSVTLLSLLFLIKPILELIDFIHSFVLRNENKKNIVPRLKFVQRWLQSRRCLAWYSLTFALLHLLFLLFSKNNFHQETSFYPVFFGLFTLVLLCILSFVYLPWISEHLLWREYHLLTAYLGPFCLLISFIHVFINWKYEYYYSSQKRLFNLQFMSMFLPFVVLLLTFIIYGIIRPTMELIQWKENRPRESKTSTITTKDTSLLP
ncbi:unnamed protein product [Rotaria socialis]|uniref:Uncharacterized protein n=1 Tax=Rotaria socialis TaxID=392032 RepID=A0A817WQ47_9BILA|nr:unnamed protein product [Rotaria socialis]CAF3370317.1 unnamed protein product [Rotaria socialis]CAF3711038.1 unnamed protein product [Rotaria socialis]CAF4309250.1 unnamed protein product [Rotaria socialis]CAF4497784.1 unnamed protein product [Rotaria socialis]